MWRRLTQRIARAIKSITLRPGPLRASAAGRVSSAWLQGSFHQPRTRGLLGRIRHRSLDYRLYVPARSATAARVPLLVMLHGCTQDADAFAAGTRMNLIAEARCFAVLYPQQSRKSNYSRCWNWFTAESVAGEGEAALIIRAIADVLNKFPVDRSRVFVAGMSAGGAMAELLAARYGHHFAACGVHSGVMYGATTNAAHALTVLRNGAAIAPAESARILVGKLGKTLVFVPTIVIHGNADAAVNPINGTQIVEQLCAIAEQLWPDETRLRPGSERVRSDGGRRYFQRDYTAEGRILVRSIVVEGLGHAWSGGDPHYEFNDAAGPDASKLIAEFVLEHRRAAAADKLDARSAPVAAEGGAS